VGKSGLPAMSLGITSRFGRVEVRQRGKIHGSKLT
jgi:hypothetical protein